MEIFDIKNKADLLYWVKSLTDKVKRSPVKDEIWRLELETIKQMIKNRHGPSWARILTCKLVMLGSFKGCIQNGELINVKNIIKQIQDR